MSKGNSITVDIADMVVSSDPGATLVTYALGSCLGLTVYDPVKMIGGMIHCMLPLSKIDPVKAEKNPYMFVDKGVPMLFREVFARGGNRDHLIIKLAGCSSLLDQAGVFKIGARNQMMARKLLWKNNLLVSGEDMGGAKSRTLKLDISTGEVLIRSKSEVYPI